MKRYDKPIALFFAVLTAAFLLLLFNYMPFVDWAYARHRNQLSWYIRPLFLIPFCYFAYQRSLAGLAITVFGLFTSMVWFPVPDAVSPKVQAFLQFEIDYTTGSWGLMKTVAFLMVPLSMGLLALAFWKKSLWAGLMLIALIALGKIAWAIHKAGDAGASVTVPALCGMFLCCLLVWHGYRQAERRKRMTQQES